MRFFLWLGEGGWSCVKRRVAAFAEPLGRGAGRKGRLPALRGGGFGRWSFCPGLGRAAVGVVRALWKAMKECGVWACWFFSFALVGCYRRCLIFSFVLQTFLVS